MRRFSMALSASLLFSSSTAWGWDSPNGDSRNSRRVAGELAPAYRRLWEMPIELFKGPPISSGNRIYVVTKRRDLVALDLRDGTTVWSVPMMARIKNDSAGPPRPLTSPTPIILGGKIFASISTGRVGRLLACDPATGRVVWEFVSKGTVSNSGAILGAPTPWRDRIVLRTGGNLTALKLSDGSVVWQAPLDKTMARILGPIPQPALGEGVMYLGATFGTAYAIDLKTGKRLWSYATGGVHRETSPTGTNQQVVISTCAPLLLRDRVIVADGTGRAHALRVSNGERIWSASIGETSQFASDGKQLIGATSTGMVKINPTNGEIISTKLLKGGAWACILGKRRAVVARSSVHDPGFEVVDLQNWKTEWQEPGFPVQFGLSMAGDTLVVGGRARVGSGARASEVSVLRAYQPVTTGIGRR